MPDAVDYTRSGAGEQHRHCGERLSNREPRFLENPAAVSTAGFFVFAIRAQCAASSFALSRFRPVACSAHPSIKSEIVASSSRETGYGESLSPTIATIAVSPS